MRMKNFVSALAYLFLLISPASALNLNMVEPEFNNNSCFGILLDGDYYSFIIEDDKLVRVEFEPCSNEEFLVELSFDDLQVLLFDNLSFLEKASYIMNNLGVSFDNMLDLKAWGVI